MKFPGLIFLFSLFLFISPAQLKAETFIVTSNADAGPGSLREAITRANANGTGETDHIHFNLPGGTTEAITIVLISDLPGLTGNIIIDASTQPGSSLGPTGSKVYIHRQTGFQEINYHAFQIENAANVEMYGLVIKKTGSGSIGYGIVVRGTSSNIIIGAPGKGNVINGFSEAINAAGNDLIENFTIQSNIIGLDESGILVTPGLSTYRPINITHVRNIRLGGDQPETGNVILGTSYSVTIICDGGDVQVSHNKIGTDITGKNYNSQFSMPGEMLFLEGNAENPTGDVLISDNLMTGTSVDILILARLANGFRMLRNKIGTDITGQAPLGSRRNGVSVTGCGPSLIGGSDEDKNIIAGCRSNAIGVGDSYFVTISENEMFCNSNEPGGYPYRSISLGWPEGAERPKPFVHVTACDGNSLSGEATPDARLEIFTVYKCDADSRCEGRNYIETIYADADGKWSYQLNGRDGVFLTATDAKGATSEYSQPFWVYDALNNVVHTACGKSEGGMTGVEIVNGTPFYWENEAGDVVSRDTSLANVPAGKYRLVMYSGGCNKPECIIYTRYVEVEDRSPAIITNSISITHADCGRKTGSILGLVYTGMNLKYTWRNAANAVISNESAIWNVGPGLYTVTLTDAVHGCSVSAGPFEIKNISGPELDVSGLALSHSTCGNPVGSITGLQVSGTGNITYDWIDASGKNIGNTIDLIGVPAGKYVLKFADQSTCGAAESDTFEIKAPGLIRIDETGLVASPSDCENSTGSLTGLVIENGEVIHWTDEYGNVAGDAAELVNSAPGKYTLHVSNSTGCTTERIFAVHQVTPAPITVAQAISRNPTCNLQNGSITDITFNGETPVSFRWIDENGMEAGNTRNLLNVGDGKFRLYVRDDHQCEQVAATIELKTPPLPAINTTQAVITDDQCNLGSGTIEGIKVTGIQPMEFSWTRNNSLISSSFSPKGLHEGTYVLEVKDANECAATSPPLQVNNTNIGLPPPLVADVVVIRGATAIFKVNQPREGTYHLYLPYSDIPLQSSNAGEFRLPEMMSTTTYHIDHQSGECVSDRVPAKAEVIDAVKVVAPNAFSPNGDGLNDIFRPKPYGLARFDHLSILDRWGNRIFYTQDPLEGWNGTSNGQKAVSGTYVWFLQGVDIKGMPVLERGFVVVVY